MTIDEAIKHCEEVADVCEFEASKYDMTDAYESHVACQEGECADEHRQLAKWLKEYKEMLLAIEEIKSLGKSQRILLIKGDEVLSLVEDIINKHTSGKEEE